MLWSVKSSPSIVGVWVEQRAAQVHNSAVACFCGRPHTWLCEDGFLCTFIIVHVGRGEGAEFAFSFSSLCIYYPFVRAKLFCISNVRKASFQDNDKTRHPVKQFLPLILRFLNQAEWNSFVLMVWEEISN